MSRKAIRCAIYTRKSSEEGLDQSFNSLDAQREAGEAYVKSQAHEGWKAIPTLYDDGGYSGGTIERPALQRLLEDVDAGRIDIVVVYKIDRLTRSLADFARIVERFDAYGVSFVSVTQSFNTTSSMGRLTLNVLLSFAQFEREVTGERIRDKIAASKAKGMWMGGTLPLGYDLPAPGTRVLRVHEDEAKVVRHIFSRYLELGSVHTLQRELASQGVLSKKRIAASGRTHGGCVMNRGALYHLLGNPIYLGRIRHKGVVHEGSHDAIIGEELFEKVKQLRAQHAPRRRASAERRFEPSPLAGKLFDANGEAMTPTFSRGSKGNFYRYYVSTSLQRGSRPAKDGIVRRIAALGFEKVVTGIVERWVPSTTTPLDLPIAIRLAGDGLMVDLPSHIAVDIAPTLSDQERIVHQSPEAIRIHVPIALPLHGGRRLVVPGTKPEWADPILIAALRKAHGMLTSHRGQPLVETAPVSPHDRKLLRLAFLAPDLQRDILAGRQPASLNLEKLRFMEIPLCWKQQRLALDWPADG
jgi:DNA invertase Pin-like site-specific DNA recombinase